MTAPDATHRTAVIGRTGSGKTQFGLYHLGVQMNGPWRGLPVTIIDPKHSRMIAEINPRALKVTDRPPSEPGLYVIRPFPGDDDKALTDYLLRVWEQENHGTYYDEMLDLGPRNRGFRRLLSQGREKNCPMIYCTQRPRWVDMYALTEADFVCSFVLRKKEDRRTVEEYAPGYQDKSLPRFHSYWYDVADDRASVLSPCPEEKVILARYYPEYLDEPEYIEPEALARAEGRRQKVLL